jgi:hypothetical protein
VDEIDGLIPEGEKKPFTVKFLKDADNWSKLEKAVSLDPEGVYSVLANIILILWQNSPDDTRCLFRSKKTNVVHPDSVKFINAAQLLLNSMNPIFKKDKEGNFSLNTETMHQFKPVDLVKNLAKTLSAYDVVYKNPAAVKEFAVAQPIGDVVPRLSYVLKEFNSDKWDKEFYDRLKIAANNNQVDPFWYSFGIVIIIVFIVGLAIFLVRRRRHQASTPPPV